MNYCNHYFRTYWANIKNTWKGITSILNINNTHSNIPKILVSSDTTSAEPIDIANILNNFFTSIAAKTKESIKYSHKNFSNFRKNRSDDSFPLTNMKLLIPPLLLVQPNQLDLIVYLLRY